MKTCRVTHKGKISSCFECPVCETCKLSTYPRDLAAREIPEGCLLPEVEDIKEVTYELSATYKQGQVYRIVHASTDRPGKSGAERSPLGILENLGDSYEKAYGRIFPWEYCIVRAEWGNFRVAEDVRARLQQVEEELALLKRRDQLRGPGYTVEGVTNVDDSIFPTGKVVCAPASKHNDLSDMYFGDDPVRHREKIQRIKELEEALENLKRAAKRPSVDKNDD